jgi:cytohesin
MLNLVSCGCGNDALPSQSKTQIPTQIKKKQQVDGELIMDVSPTSLEGADKITEITFKLKGDKKAILANYTIGITSICIANSIEQKKRYETRTVADFCLATELTSSKNILKIPYKVVEDDKKFDLVTIEFKLTDNKGSVPITRNVTWKKGVVPEVHLKLTKLFYNQASGSIIFSIQNSAAVPVKDVQLRYTNISTDEVEKAAVLNSQQTGIINITNISVGDSTEDQVLPIDFKLATKAKFKFEILYRGNPVKGGTIEQYFHDKPPVLKLVPLDRTASDKTIQFKIEKEAKSGNIDPSKLKLLISETTGSSSEVYYNGEKAIEIMATRLGNIGDTIKLIVHSKKAIEASFALQLVYDGSNIGSVQTFKWIIDSTEATHLLFEAIDTIDNSNDIEATIDLLLAKGASLDAKDAHGDTLIHKVVEKGNREAAELLITKGASLNAANRHRNTPLHLAIKKRDKEIIKIFIEKGANICAENNDGESPISQAIISNDQEILDELLKSNKGYINDTCFRSDFTALHLAASIDNKVVIEKLLAKGANINTTNEKYGNSPLHLAVNSNKQVAIEALLAGKGINVNILNNRSDTSLHLAIRKGNRDLISLLLAREDINTNIGDNKLYTPLHLAVKGNKGNNEEAVKLLLSKGADINAKNKSKDTPLHIAVRRVLKNPKNVNTNIVKLLLDQGALKDKPDDQGRTAIDVNIANKQGNTPLHIAISGGDEVEVLVKLLLDKGARTDISNLEGNTPLHTAVSGGDEVLVKLLLDKGARTDISNLEGNTPLHTAISGGDEVLVKLLLDKGKGHEQI